MSAEINSQLFAEAADWAMTLRYDTPTESQRLALERWRQQSPQHQAAWLRAQEVFHTFERLPPALGKKAVTNLGRSCSRRQALQALSSMLVAVPAGWLAWRQLPWREWTADMATATGERRTIELPDGSRLVLNTASAVNIAFSSTERRIRLVAGEILITTRPDSAPMPRPFFVDTSAGVVRALGTRFSVRRMDESNFRVAVFESAVEIRPLSGSSRILEAGEQANFDLENVLLLDAVENTAALWEQGMLLAKDMRLTDVVSELARYRPGVLRCDPAVSNLLVSGAISLTDTDATLALLEKNLPLRISRRTAYWIKVGPRD